LLFCLSWYFLIIVILCCQCQCSWLPGKTVPKMTHYVSRGTLSNCSLIEASLVDRFFHSFLTPYNQRLNECVVLCWQDLHKLSATSRHLAKAQQINRINSRILSLISDSAAAKDSETDAVKCRQWHTRRRIVLKKPQLTDIDVFYWTGRPVANRQR